MARTNKNNASNIMEINPWDIKLSEFPKSGSLTEKIQFILSLAILAPSTHNSQPWLFRLQGDICQVEVDTSIKLPNSDPTGRDLYISHGCLAEAIEQVANYFGFSCVFQFIDNNNLIFQVQFIPSEAEVSKKSMIEALLSRVNVRGMFDKKEIPAQLNEQLTIYSDEQVKFVLLSGKDKTKYLAQLTAQAIAEAHNNKNFRYELSQWMRPSLTKKLDGLVGYNLRIPFLLSFIFPPLIKLLNLGKLFAQLNRQAIASAPAAGIMLSPEDTPISWWQVGRRFFRLNLYLNSIGLRTSIYVGAIEIGNHRAELKKFINTDWLPQFSFVVGYMSGNFRHSPRYNLKSRLIHD